MGRVSFRISRSAGRGGPEQGKALLTKNLAKETLAEMIINQERALASETQFQYLGKTKGGKKGSGEGIKRLSQGKWRFGWQRLKESKE